MDAGARRRQVRDHRDADGRPDRTEIIDGGRGPTPVRIRLRHRDVPASHDPLAIARPFDLHRQGGRPLQREDERGGFRERGEEGPSEGDHLIADADHAEVGKQTEPVEGDERADDVRMERVFVVHPPDRLPEEARKGLHLLVRDEIRALGPDGSGEGKILRLAERVPDAQFVFEPHGRTGEDIRQERLPRREGKESGARGDEVSRADSDRVDRLERFGGIAGHHVGDPGVESHRDQGGTARALEFVGLRELCEDAGRRTGFRRARGGDVEIVRADLHRGIHDP